jgi:hypothetical protein
MNKTVGLVLLAFGVVLIVAGAAVRFVILPGQAQWPDDVDSTRTYEGTLHVMLNPEALATLDLANLFVRELPITLSRHVTTEDVDGGKAIVRELATMIGPGGNELQGSDTCYAIDRKSMRAIAAGSASGMAGGDSVTDREGLVIGFPIGTEAKDYEGWSSDYQKVLALKYVGEEERGGINTYMFEAESTPMETKDPEKLALFPSSLAKDLLIGLAQTLDLPASLRERFAEILPELPDPTSLTYTYEFETKYWVEPATGVLIDYDKHEAYKVALQLPGLPVPVPIVPVFEQSYHMSPASVQDAVKDAQDARSQLNLFGTIVPVALGGVGLLLVVVGLVVVLRR